MHSPYKVNAKMFFGHEYRFKMTLYRGQIDLRDRQKSERHNAIILYRRLLRLAL